MMKARLALAAITALTTGVIPSYITTSQALAADPAAAKAEPAPEVKPLIAWPEPNLDILAGGWDYALGAKWQSNYIFRGISQTANRPNATVYAEGRYGWFYAGVQPWNVTLPTNPFAEVDVYGGIRPAWGPLTLDFGIIGYIYPNNSRRYWINGAAGAIATYQSPGATPTSSQDPTYYEAYWKGSWAVNDYFTAGVSFFYSPNWGNLGAKELYSEINGKISWPDTGFSVSGAYGWQYLGRGNIQYGYSYVDNLQAYTMNPRGFKFTSYNYWNVGASYTWKQITFDVRYHGNNLGSFGCASDSSDPSANGAFAATGVGRSGWCGHKVVAGVSLDFTSASFKPDLPGNAAPKDEATEAAWAPPNSNDR